MKVHTILFISAGLVLAGFGAYYGYQYLKEQKEEEQLYAGLSNGTTGSGAQSSGAMTSISGTHKPSDSVVSAR